MFTDVLFEVADGVGKATLNRPQQMNALTLDMIRALDDKLAEWAKDTSIRAVMIHGAGDKAFCAGGDIRALYDAKKSGNGTLLSEFFWHEYRLDYRIATYPKQLIAVMDGLTMGGGAGIGLNAPVRVASERVVFSMPECAIGLYPDIGAAHFLQRCPGELGMFLALTGLRLRTAGLYHCNLVTHTVPSERLGRLMPESLSIDNMTTRTADISKLQPAIDVCFGAQFGRRHHHRTGEPQRSGIDRQPEPAAAWLAHQPQGDVRAHAADAREDPGRRAQAGLAHQPAHDGGHGVLRGRAGAPDRAR